MNYKPAIKLIGMPVWFCLRYKNGKIIFVISFLDTQVIQINCTSLVYTWKPTYIYEQIIMQFHYSLFPHRVDQCRAKEDAGKGLNRVKDKGMWAREDANKNTWDIQMQHSMLTGNRLIFTPQSPTRMVH